MGKYGEPYFKNELLKLFKELNIHNFTYIYIYYKNLKKMGNFISMNTPVSGQFLPEA